MKKKTKKSKTKSSINKKTLLIHAQHLMPHAGMFYQYSKSEAVGVCGCCLQSLFPAVGRVCQSVCEWLKLSLLCTHCCEYAKLEMITKH